MAELKDLKAQLTRRDHALILLGIASAIIIWWLLHRRLGNGGNTTLDEQSGSDLPDVGLPDLTFPGQDYGPGVTLPGYVIGLILPDLDVSFPGFSSGWGGYVSSPDELSYTPGGPMTFVGPGQSIPIQNCDCGCSEYDSVPINIPTKPQQVLAVSNPNPPAPTIVVVPPPPPAKKAKAKSLLI